MTQTHPHKRERSAETAETMQRGFNTWFLRYAAAQYPFYKPESAADALRSSLGQSLLSAYRAGYAAAIRAASSPAPTAEQGEGK